MVSENGKFNMNYKEPYSQHFSAHFFETKLRFSGGYHSIHMYPSQLMLTSGFQAVLCATWYAHPVQGRSMEVMVMRKSEPSICTVPANYAFGWDTYPSAISWFMVYIFVCIEPLYLGFLLVFDVHIYTSEGIELKESRNKL